MIEFFLRRSSFTNLCTLILIAVGAYQFATVKREAFPDVEFDIVMVATVYPGASPEEVERLVTNPVEDALRGISGVNRVESWSVASVSHVFLRLEEGLDRREVDRAVTDIQQAASRIRDLPAEADRPVVEEMTSDRALISLSIVGGTRDSRYGVAEEITDALEDIPEVSRVVGDGKPPREIWVEADPAALAERDLSLGQVSQAISAQNVNLTAGTVGSGSRELVVRALGGMWTADDVRSVILKGNDEREFIRVGDVARVTETFEDQKYHVRVNGQPAITLRVMKRSETDAIRLTDSVRSVKERFATKLAKLGMALVESDDASFFIKRRLKVMKTNMILGAILILGAMLLFLNWRLAFVASLGIGVSLAAAFAFGVPLGMSFNLLSMMGFIIVLGMLNDDAIVVTDNIYRHLQMGKPRFEAALDGTREVIAPVMGAILTSCFAFIPFALMSGIMGKFLVVFPMIIILCLISSMLEAFFILPAHVLEMSRFGVALRRSAPPRWFAVVQAEYRRTLGWSLDHRGAFVLLAAAAFAGTVLLGAWRLRVEMFPPGMVDIFFVAVEMPTGATLARTDAALTHVERAVAGIPPEEMDVMISTIGQSGYEYTTRRGTHLAQVQVNLRPQENRDRTTDEIISEIRRMIGTIPGVRKLAFETVHPGPPVGAAFNARIRGNDARVLTAVATEYKAELARIPGVEDIRDSFEEGKDELIIQPRLANLAYAGLTTAAVSHQLLSAYQGIEATKIRRATEEVVVRVKLAEESQGRAAIDHLLVPNPMGRPVPLGQLISLKPGRGEEYIAHYDYRRVVNVSASVDNARATSFSVNQHMRRKFRDVAERHPGANVIYGGEEEETQKSFRSLGRGFAVAVLLNLAILMAIFRSWHQPFLILLTVPIGLMGATYALVAHGDPISLMALLGAVAMTGVVVNNAIVLLDFVNRLRARGLTVRKALIQGGAVRLRPIFASSLTTLLCLFPTAYGFGGKEPFVQPLALTMAWGLTFATPLTLFAIPIAYSLNEDAMNFIARRLDLGGGNDRRHG